MSKPGDKTIFEQRSKCPYCSKLIHTKVTRVTIIKSVPGQTEIQGIVEKDPQSTLEKDFNESQKKTKQQRDQEYIPGEVAASKQAAKNKKPVKRKAW